MAILESQLETWSHQGAIAGSRSTYATVKNVLESAASPYAGKLFKVFLQGSYGNDTNIFSESDVDIVIRLDSAFKSDRSELSTAEEQAWEAAYRDATYGLPQFKRDVLTFLQQAFPNDVTVGDKALSIKASNNRRKADVLPCIAFRRYHRFDNVYDAVYDEGICFYDRSGTQITNYPRQHCENLSRKHQASGNRLKPMIRTMKNLRNKLIVDGSLKEGRAPSYYIEGLLYNVPDDRFSTSFQETFVKAITWIQKEADKSKLKTANEQYYLLRDGVKTCWPPADCEMFLNAAINLWING